MYSTGVYVWYLQTRTYDKPEKLIRLLSCVQSHNMRTHTRFSRASKMIRGAVVDIEGYNAIAYRRIDLRVRIIQIQDAQRRLRDID